MILRWVVVVGTVAAAAAQSPVIKTTGQNNIAIQIPVGSSATVEYVNSAGQVVSTSPLATLADLSTLQSNFSTAMASLQATTAADAELLGRQIASLNLTKQNTADSAAAFATIQTEITNALTAIGTLQNNQGNLSALTQNQANCHVQGLIYNQTSNRCEVALTVSCGTSFVPTPASNHRVSGNCAGNHFFGDTCQAVCASGFTGQEQTWRCEIDGQWRPVSSARPCLDTNECANTTLANCQQTCTNFPGGFQCGCNSNAVLQPDGRTCQTVNVLPIQFQYQYNNYLRQYTVPVGVNRIAISAWGSGGASRFGQSGGAGAYAEGTFSVTPGQILVVAIGGPGTGWLQPANGSVTNNYPHPPGGGLVGVFNGSRPTQSNALVVAGSGGGAGSNRARNGGSGGDASGGQTAIGPSNVQACLGRGASATAPGGAAGTADVLGTAGAALTGGRAGSYGSGGGAGYWGGGGGGHCPGRKFEPRPVTSNGSFVSWSHVDVCSMRMRWRWWLFIRGAGSIVSHHQRRRWSRSKRARTCNDPRCNLVIRTSWCTSVHIFTTFPDLHLRLLESIDVRAWVMNLNASSAPGALFLSGCNAAARPR
eukprot:m.133984 g.133984  ORF g.133984 m.133984 type:complete len:594 (+) comp13851_c0_seq2:1386-3167(+)